MNESPYISIRVDEWKIREIFNRGHFKERAEAGEITRIVKRSKEIFDHSLQGWMPGTLSQEIRYYDVENKLLAKAHCYQRPDGRLAASGREDPKRVLEDNVMYILELPKSR